MDFLELISIRKSIVTLVKRLVNSEWKNNYKKMASHILRARAFINRGGKEAILGCYADLAD